MPYPTGFGPDLREIDHPASRQFSADCRQLGVQVIFHKLAFGDTFVHAVHRPSLL
jgi:ERCC4-type nuclease